MINKEKARQQIIDTRRKLDRISDGYWEDEYFGEDTVEELMDMLEDTLLLAMQLLKEVAK
ncbi:hypothetical protein NHG29_01735 [Aerococcaceae bacterium NML160702]|nr:hypothetical protein [Aerococcaceae bacterium NML160702]